ncbi:MAG: O-antigen ligase family protein [Methylococcaceae bacterium]|nr:O-antigen ligase family protein [Methylococcaceae bacterium]
MFPFYSLLVVLVLSPLPFGSNRPWSWSMLCIFIALITIYWCISFWGNDKKRVLQFERIKTPFFLFISVLLWGYIQAQSFIPESWGHPFWQLTAQALAAEIPSTISLVPEQTVTAIMRLLSYGLVFILAMYYCQKADCAEKLFNWLAIAGFIYAVYGLIIYFGNFNKILWFDKWAYKNEVSSTFINRNSYATYAGLSLLCLIPNILQQFKSSARYGLNGNYGKQLFIENIIIRSWRQFLMFFTIGTALFLTHSRGGFLSTALAIITLFILLSVSNKLRNRALSYASLAIIVIAVTLFNVSSDKLMERMAGISIAESERPKVYEATINGIASNPYLGFGYGTYESSFRLYRTKEVRGHFDKAHNTYLENIFELGIPAASTLFLSVFMIALKCLTGIWNRQRNWIYPAIGFSSTVLVATHAFVDFSLQIPAIAITYSAILGAGFSQSFSSRN